MKYKVLITRREIYHHEVEVEAKNPLEAEDKVCRAYYNDEYESMLDCLADVEKADNTRTIYWTVKEAA